MGEVLCERRDNDPGSRILPCQRHRPVKDDDGLSGSGSSAQTERPVPPTVDEAALRRVQEHPPGAEVSILDDSSQLVDPFDCGELHGCCGTA